MKNNHHLNRGFTLIELLIVITLIAILAVAVLAALNPIEQINKSRDAARKTDAAQLLQAIERYFVTTAMFPWDKYEIDNGDISSPNPPEDEFVARADMPGVGVCFGTGASGTTFSQSATTGSGCATTNGDGILIQSDEIKPQFSKRSYFQSDRGKNDTFIIIKEDTSSAVNVCFIPASNANRESWNVAGGPLSFIGDGSGAGTVSDAGTPTTTLGVPAAGSVIEDCATARGTTAPDWDDFSEACYVCVPDSR